MMGLALCSATELSFNLEGFIAALLTNLSEWYSIKIRNLICGILKLITAYCVQFAERLLQSAVEQ